MITTYFHHFMKMTAVPVALFLFCITACSLSINDGSAENPSLTKYSVTFDAEGGVPSPDKQTVNANAYVVKPAEEPVLDGFHFGGWYAAGSSTAYDFSTPVTAGLTLKAKWQVIVTFDANGGTFTDKPETETTCERYFDKGTAVTAPGVKRIEAGKTWNLLCWSLEPDAEKVEQYDLSAGTQISVTLKAVWTESYVVAFDTNGSMTDIEAQSVKSGDCASLPPVPPSSYGYDFCGWYAEDSTSVYNFATPVTGNLTLKAKWVAVMDGLKSVENGKIVLTMKVYSSAINEGDFTATYAAGSSEPAALPITYVSTSLYDVTYSFEAFTPAEAETYTITVTNGFETKSKSFTVYPLAAVSNLKASAEDSKVTLTWDTVSGYSNYRITCSDGVSGQTVSSAASAVFKGLANGTEYTFSVYTRASSASDAAESEVATVKAVPAVTKKTTDWLLLMYMDGDNTLNDPMYLDMNEAEYGLYSAKTSSGSAASGYGSMNVVALWDGWVGNNDEKPQIGKAGSYLFELGRDSSNLTYYTTDGGCVLSSDTKDLSYTAPWLSSGEVDMSDKATLINFLKWAKERYGAENVILQFSDHGGGPRSAAQYVTLPDGRRISLPGTDGRRSMCWDEASVGTTFLKTADIPVALTAAGYGSDNKLGMIVEDVCLGGSVEEAYELRDYAHYFLASPNNMPGMGLDYTDFVKSFKSSASLKDVGTCVVDDFRNDNQLSASKWASLVSTYTGYGIPESEVSYYASEASTLTFVDLTKIAAVESALNELAVVLTSQEGKTKVYAGYYYDNDGRFTKTDTGKPVLYTDYIRERTCRFDCAMDYAGSFTWLYDAGYVINTIAAESKPSTADHPNANTWEELYDASVSAGSALMSCIINAWRDGNNGNHNLYYTADTKGSIVPVNICGLTISGGTVEYISSGGKTTLLHEKNPSWYKTALAFGRDSKWGDLLESWFGEY
jgi:uncharacterized repeat protein (TIGR02543 family)